MSIGSKRIDGIKSELCDPLVLVAKDDLIGRRLTCDILKSKGYRVLEVKNAKRVVEATLQNQPDLVLIDFRSQSAAITAMLENIKKDKRLSQIPFLTVTNPAEGLNIINDISDEVDAAFKKPTSTVSIVEKIESILASLRKYASR